MNNPKTNQAKLIRKKRAAYVTARRNMERLIQSLQSMAKIASDIGREHRSEKSMAQVADYEATLRSCMTSDVMSVRQVIEDFATLSEQFDEQ